MKKYDNLDNLIKKEDVKNSGIINFLKPVGMTSSDAVVIVKRTLKADKVGHLGTLDPLASGVLPIAYGKCTSLFDLFLNKEKQYRAFFDFSYSTDTFDNDGEITAKSDKIITREDILAVLPKFLGKIEQIPPKFSAKSIGGVRAYKLARKDEDFEIAPSTVEIYDITLVEQYSKCGFVFDITCSAGTYIRSIARDLGQELGACGTMTALIRLKSGQFEIENSITQEELQEKKQDAAVLAEDAVDFLEKMEISDKKRAYYLINGINYSTEKPDGKYRLYLMGQFYGIITVENNTTGKIVKLV